MSKRFKKVIAVVCAIAMVVGTMSVGNVAKADIYSEDTTAWSSWFAGAGSLTADGTDGYTVSGSIGTTWWNIQTWLPSVNFTKGYTYTCSFTLTTTQPKNFKVDRRNNDAVIFTETSTEGWVENGDGTYSYNYVGTSAEIATTEQFDVRVSFGYFDDGTEQAGWAANNTINMTMSDFTITRVATGETEADPTKAALEDGYNAVAKDTWTTVGNWKLYAGAGSPAEISYKGEGADFSDLTLSLTKGAAGNTWGIQAGIAVDGLVNGTQYDYTMVINSDKTGTLFTQVPGVTQSGDLAIAVGDNTISGTFTAGANPANGAIMIFPNGMPDGTHLDMVSLEVKEHVEEPTEAPTEAPTGEGETTAPSTGDDEYANLTWKQVGTTDYYVAAANDEFPINTVNDQGTKVEIVPGVAEGTKPIWPAFTNETLNGVEGSYSVGAGIFIEYASLNDNAYNVYQATSAVDNHTFQIIIKAGNPAGGSEEPTEVPTEVPTEAPTEAPSIAWTELFNNGQGTATDTSTEDALGAVFTGFVTDWSWGADSKWHGQAKKADIPVTAGQAYKVSFDIVSTPAKQILVQALSGGVYTENTYNSADGSIEMTFEATADTAQIVIAFGAISEAEAGTYDVTISNFKVEETVIETYTVTVDGTEIAAVEAGETVTLPTAATYGYYIDGAMYKAGATVTVNADMAFTSVNELSVTVANGAGIKLDGNGTSGIRFQASVASNNMDAVASDAITEGMLITANDIYEEIGNSVMDLTSTYTLKNIPNSGWFNGTVGTYCGSIVKIAESNYIRDFIAKAYVTVNYVDGESVTVYSGMSQVRNIAQVADKLIAAGALGQYTAAEQAIINTFAAAN